MFHIFFSVCWALISVAGGRSQWQAPCLRRGLCDMNLLGHFLGNPQVRAHGAFFMIWPDLGGRKTSQPPAWVPAFTELHGQKFFGLPCRQVLRGPGCRVNACFRSCSYSSQWVLRGHGCASALSSQESPLHLRRPQGWDPQGHAEVS